MLAGVVVVINAIGVGVVELIAVVAAVVAV